MGFQSTNFINLPYTTDTAKSIIKSATRILRNLERMNRLDVIRDNKQTIFRTMNAWSFRCSRMPLEDKKTSVPGFADICLGFYVPDPPDDLTISITSSMNQELLRPTRVRPNTVYSPIRRHLPLMLHLACYTEFFIHHYSTEVPADGYLIGIVFHPTSFRDKLILDSFPMMEPFEGTVIEHINGFIKLETLPADMLNILKDFKAVLICSFFRACLYHRHRPIKFRFFEEMEWWWMKEELLDRVYEI